MKMFEFLRAGDTWSGHERNCAYLNLGTGRFANFSAVSGFDFADDGRGMCLVDWDHDGDQDVWLANRSSPRVRFLRNTTDAENHFLALRLVGNGTTTNRDAIGARVEVVTSGESRVASRDEEGKKTFSRDPQPSPARQGERASVGRRAQGENEKEEGDRLMKTLRAGEGFLSQSSKWLHFGLGQQTGVQRVIVHWPGGTAETFTGLEADRHYRLQQGAGEVRAWTPPVREIHLAPSKFQPPEPKGELRALLVHRVPLPRLSYQTFAGQSQQLGGPTSQPVLVNLWASWCRPCLVELKRFAQSESTLRDAGVELVALSVDGVAAESSSTPADARRIVDQLKLPFVVGQADAVLLDKLQIMVNELFGKDVPLAVPSSLLLDREGRVAAIYRGPVEVEQVVKDLQSLPLEGEALERAAETFPGRWINVGHDSVSYLSLVTTALRNHGYEEDAEAYFSSHAPDAKNDPRYGRLLLGFANKLYQEGRRDEAIEKYREAIQAGPKLVSAHLNLGIALAGKQQHDKAAAAFRRAVEINPDDFDAHFHLATSLGRLYQLDEAITHFGRAIELKPDFYHAHLYLANVLKFQRKFAEASGHFRQALEMNSELTDAQYGLGLTLLELGNVAEGTDLLRAAGKQHERYIQRMNSEAWRLAADHDSKQRNPDQAVVLAELAHELQQPPTAALLDTLAVAYAAAERFEEAVSTAQQALQALPSNQPQIAEQIRARLELFRQRKAYHDAAPAKP
ncbi:tetratricopeptide repeat protein [Pirellulales bacterium]|nr:tetratricopeptide repeat protein [Pirellulales bacterium]